MQPIDFRRFLGTVGLVLFLLANDHDPQPIWSDENLQKHAKNTVAFLAKRWNEIMLKKPFRLDSPVFSQTPQLANKYIRIQGDGLGV